MNGIRSSQAHHDRARHTRPVGNLTITLGDNMSHTLIVLALFSAVALPAITRSTVLYAVVATAFVALAAAVHWFVDARASLRERAHRVA